jgi:site-specific recombinase XerD
MTIKTPLVQYVWNRYGKATSKKEAVVELRVTYERRQKYISTNIWLLPKHWRNGTVVNRVDAIQLNQTLDKLIVEVRKVIFEMMEEDNIDIFSIPNRLKRLRTGGISFIEFCQKRADIRSYNKSSDSAKRYERFMRKFIEWGEIEHWEDINEENIIAFDGYLAAKGFKPYSKWQNYHRFLNSFIIDAVNEGLLTKNPYKWVQIEKDKSRTGIGKYLTPEEFEKIRSVRMTTDSLERVRDLFVFQTYTCMAYTDMSAFDANKIQEVKGMKVYSAKRNKTKETFTIPLLSPALEILKKYKNKLPVISNVKYNEYLKVVAQAAGIDKPVSSHWARHTGATLLLNQGGLDMKIVAKICGHSSTRITEKVYAKLLDESVVDAMAGMNEII